MRGISFIGPALEYHIRLVPGGKYRDPKKTFPVSNEIALTMADAAMIKRNWGERIMVLRWIFRWIKDTFALGEDVALHIAFENLDADAPIYRFSPLWDPSMQ